MFANVASVYHQARDELNNIQRHSLALSHPDTPVPLPDPSTTARFSCDPQTPHVVTHTPLSNPPLQCLDIDLGDPVQSLLPSPLIETPKTVQSQLQCIDIDLGDLTVSPFPSVVQETPLPYVVIDIDDIEETQTQSFIGSCYSSVLNFFKGLFSMF